MLDPFLGSIMMFGGTFAPVGWAFCDGTLLSISQNSALFALLGTQYGGNGTTNFALPDLRGRVPIHFGQGPGLSNRVIGQASGTETEALNTNQMPAHSHSGGTSAGATSQPATATDPAGRVFAVPLDGGSSYSNAANGQLGGGASLPVEGGSQAHSNLQPYTCISFCIATQGIFPSRN